MPAQNTPPVTDTVRIGTLSTEDTSVYEETEEPPEAEAEETSEDKENYFLPKRMAGAGIDSIRLRHLPDSLIRALKEDDDFSYPDAKKSGEAIAGQGGNKTTTREIDPPKRKERLSQQSWFQGLLWILIVVGFIAFLVIWLSGSNIGIFSRTKRKIAEETEEEMTDDIFAINYQKEIDKAAGSGNYRFAIRLMFLCLLKEMAEKNIIRYKHDSTNLDYLVQLGHSHHYQDFFRITRNYEYSWYGQFEVREETYKVIKSDFDRFGRKLN